MAATYTPTQVDAFVAGNKRFKIVDIALSGTYTTGGDALNASALGLTRVLALLGGSATDGTVQYPVQPVYSTSGTSVTLKLFESGGTAGTAAAEKGSGESLTGITVRVVAIGY